LTDGWTVARARGAAADLHGRPLGPHVERAVTVLDVERASLVLGSTQPDSDVDRDAVASAAVDVVRRRSGGGAVLLLPGQQLWVDVEIPRDDPLWVDDVGRSFDWLGRAWRAAVAQLRIDARVHVGALVETRWSRRVCFGGIGPGELVVDGGKLVGISQRRTRDGARFQCVVHRRWDPRPLVDLLTLERSERKDAIADLATAGTGIDVEGGVLVDALLSNIPQPA
jgi:lipoate-protein ligase A